MSTRRGLSEGGYTLVEFAIAMTIFTIFMAFATPLLFTHLRGALRTENRADLQQSSRAALRMMVRELRQASALYASPPDKPSGRSSLSFGVDLDGNGTINSYTTDAPLEQITYYVAGNTLYRARRHGEGSPLAVDVNALSFTLYGSNLALDHNGDGIVSEDELNTNDDQADQDGDGSPDPVWQASELANVTRVAISLTVSAQGESQTYVAQAFLRNQVLG